MKNFRVECQREICEWQTGIRATGSELKKHFCLVFAALKDTQHQSIFSVGTLCEGLCLSFGLPSRVTPRVRAAVLFGGKQGGLKGTPASPASAGRRQPTVPALSSTGTPVRCLSTYWLERYHTAREQKQVWPRGAPKLPLRVSKWCLLPIIGYRFFFFGFRPVDDAPPVDDHWSLLP